MKNLPPAVAVLAGLALVALAGCASYEKAPADIELPPRPEGLLSSVKMDLSKATAADIDMAIEMATLAKDPGAPYRLRCYTTLRKYVSETLASTPAVSIKGVVSAYERAVELDLLARQGLSAIPTDVHANCAAEIINLQEFALRVGLKFAPLPGAGAIGGALR